jgi:hypothetical protein
MPKKHAGGRPRDGEAIKLAPLNMRTSPELRTKIEEAADANGRSLTQEVERRLITSFIFDDARGGPHIGALANMLCSAIQMIELSTGKKWTEDTDTWEAAQAATIRFLRWTRPPSPHDDALLKVGEQSTRAHETYREAARALSEFRKEHGFEVKPPPKAKRPGLGDVLLEAVRASAPDPATARAEWTPEQRREEAKLEEDCRVASEAMAKASVRLHELLDPVVERQKNARASGEAMAESLFQQIGPKAKKA